ncbi:aminodeoxychorismate synthase component I [Frigidibacter oleivorans]|uniref:aminodeoxychorismate synthase component I n=1 Tax=Frigidibacter oleivorans TaxID=2487129 RepID=UPI001F215184|nr:aminodeoxychorismate synthase component I [Frigidibacter oleivorans]
MFRAPRGMIRAATGAEVAPALAAAEAALAAGHWVAGHLAYEAGLALEPRLEPLLARHAAEGPLVQLAVFDGPAPAAEARAALDATGPASLTPPVPSVTEADHAAALARVLDWIAAGDIYQANLTFPLTATATGTPAALFARLLARQRVDHAALVDLPGSPAILSLSPELFFDTDGQGGIAVRPMKGTRPRAADPAEDAALAADLRGSVKDRAENLMIVDLMRNDLSRICDVGSVRVPALFRVESYATLHQMVSEVRGRLLPGTGLAAIFRALFPCGSITGAPKIRAMQIIDALEPRSRGAYCGSIGWAAPDGRARFNVAIRTLTLARDGSVRLNAGGGIVADSTAASEWQEALWKTRFATLA